MGTFIFLILAIDERSGYGKPWLRKPSTIRLVKNSLSNVPTLKWYKRKQKNDINYILGRERIHSIAYLFLLELLIIIVLLHAQL